MEIDLSRKFVIHFAGEDAGLLSKWQAALSASCPHQARAANRVQQLFDQLKEESPDLLIMDYSLLKNDGIAQLDEILHLCPSIKILLMESSPQKHLDPVEGVKRGIRGYCDRQASDHLFRKVVESILMRGEVWLERGLVQRLIEQLSSDHKASTLSTEQRDRKTLLASLSTREMEVANRVFQGESNKRIADALAITERTVKAHLSAIFKKLGITSRLHLAIFFRH